MDINHFVHRHVGISDTEEKEMLKTIGISSIDELINQTIPNKIRLPKDIDLEKAMTESEVLNHLYQLADENKICKTYIGLGYYPCFTPSVIKRNMLENPQWYTPYTPYQAEISQGRLEALLNYQTMVLSLTEMDVANASLLDEATAACEAMVMFFNTKTNSDAVKFFIDDKVFPQTKSVLKTRAYGLGIELVFGDYRKVVLNKGFFGALVQFPNADGSLEDYKSFISTLKQNDIKIAVATDPMSLVLLQSPAKWGVDVVFGSIQRFGLPMGFGGPHAAYFATTDKYRRNIPGRIIGITLDKHNNYALRMALQTREQHIKREKATSNICTSQALLANMAGMFAVFHGAEGLINIATQIHNKTVTVDNALKELGYKQVNSQYFDTLQILIEEKTLFDKLYNLFTKNEINLRYEDNKVFISLDEEKTLEDIELLINLFKEAKGNCCITCDCEDGLYLTNRLIIKDELLKKQAILTEAVFNKNKSETELMRYIKSLEEKDISLTQSMIPLGSCTMKLNAATEMLPLSWAGFGNIHPFAPKNQTLGYLKLIEGLKEDLCKITGFTACTMQPNSGAAGEYAGLMIIRKYHDLHMQSQRNIILIPHSAHGTNPASSALAGYNIVEIACDSCGNIDMNDLKAKTLENKDVLAGIMVTYPSTHGIFEEDIVELCHIVHSYGGLVYMDGANLNAQIGYTSPAFIGADVCHINLHKSFAIPHGGGGPGMGPVCVNDKLKDLLPSHVFFDYEDSNNIDAVSASHYGSASILSISYAYIKMMSADGLKRATQLAILNANYIASALEDSYGILYKGKNGRVGHELILNCQSLKLKTGIGVIDIAKRLIDYGFHAPTLSFPVIETLMVEPSESESKYELDRFIEAMQSIKSEVMEIVDGVEDKDDNVLKNAPHTAFEIASDTWAHKYSRQKAAYPLENLKKRKYWSSVARINDAFGDRNFVCKCE